MTAGDAVSLAVGGLGYCRTLRCTSNKMACGKTDYTAVEVTLQGYLQTKWFRGNAQYVAVQGCSYWRTRVKLGGGVNLHTQTQIFGLAPPPPTWYYYQFRLHQHVL